MNQKKVDLVIGVHDYYVKKKKIVRLWFEGMWKNVSDYSRLDRNMKTYIQKQKEEKKKKVTLKRCPLGLICIDMYGT